MHNIIITDISYTQTQFVMHSDIHHTTTDTSTNNNEKHKCKTLGVINAAQ